MMAFTGKQQRDGTDMAAPIHDPSPSDNTAGDWSGAISGLVGQAQGAADTYSSYGHTIFTGETAQTADLTLGNTWEWDDGLAVPDVPGEWSLMGVTANNSPNANTPSNVTGKGGS